MAARNRSTGSRFGCNRSASFRSSTQVQPQDQNTEVSFHNSKPALQRTHLPIARFLSPCLDTTRAVVCATRPKCRSFSVPASNRSIKLLAVSKSLSAPAKSLPCSKANARCKTVFNDECAEDKTHSSLEGESGKWVLYLQTGYMNGPDLPIDNILKDFGAAPPIPAIQCPVPQFHELIGRQA